MHLELTKIPERLVVAIEGRRGFKDDALFGLEQPWCECHLLQWGETGGAQDGRHRERILPTRNKQSHYDEYMLALRQLLGLHVGVPS